MQNIVINMHEKFHYGRLRNDRALGIGISDNSNNNNNVGSAWGPVSGSKNLIFYNRVDKVGRTLCALTCVSG